MLVSTPQGVCGELCRRFNRGIVCPGPAEPLDTDPCVCPDLGEELYTLHGFRSVGRRTGGGRVFIEGVFGAGKWEGGLG